MPNHEPLVFFLALFGLYSPVAALASYLPILHPYRHAQVFRLALGLTINAAVFVLAASWVGEPRGARYSPWRKGCRAVRHLG